MQRTYILNVGAEIKSEFNFCSLRMPSICVAVFNVPSHTVKVCLKGENHSFESGGFTLIISQRNTM